MGSMLASLSNLKQEPIWCLMAGCIPDWSSHLTRVVMLDEASDWSRVITWPGYWALIGCNVWWIIFICLIIGAGSAGPGNMRPLTYIRRCSTIQFYDMQRSRTRFAMSRQPFDRIWGHDCDGIVWRARIRIYRFTGHNVGAEFHKSSYKGNVQEFSRLICMRCFLSGVSQNSSGLFETLECLFGTSP